MASNKIERKDLVDDNVFTIGTEYAENIREGIKANEDLVKSFAQIKSGILGLTDASEKYKKVANNQAFIAAKKEEAAASKLAADGVKNHQAALVADEKAKQAIIETEKKYSAAIIASEKAKQASLETEKKSIQLESQKNTAQQRSIKMSAQERVDSQLSNATKRQSLIISSTLSNEYQKQEAKLNMLRKAYKDLAVRQELHGNLTKKEVAEMKQLEAQANKIDGALKKVDAAVGQSQRNVGNYSSAFKNLNGIVRATIGAFGLYSGIQIAKDIFNQIKEIDALNKALLKVTETEGRFNAEQAFLANLAEEAGLGLNVLQGAYTKFLASAKTTNLTIDETRNIFRQTAKAGAVLGLSADDITGSMRALEQILSKGKVQAEEIRGQLGERLPGAFQILAKSMGLTTQQLSKQLELGNVISEEVLPKFAEELEKVYGLDTVKRVDTVIAAQNRLSNEWRLFITSVEDGEGVISTVFKSIVTEISETIRFYRELNNESEKFKPGAYKSELNDVRKQAELTGQTEQEIAERRLVSRNESLKAAQDELDLKKRSLELYKEETSTIEKVFPLSQKYMAVVNSFKDDIEGKKENINLIKGQISALEELIGTKEKDNDVTETSIKKAKEQRDYLFEANKFINERKISILKDFAEDEKRDFDLRQVNLKTAADLEIKLVEYVTTEKLKKIKKGSEEERLILMQAQAQKQDIGYKLDDDTVDLEIEKLKAEAATKVAIQERLINEELEREDKVFQETLDSYDKVEDAIEAHEKRVFDIKKKWSLESLNLQIDNLETLMAASGFNEQERAENEAKVAAIRQQLSELTTKEIIDNYNKEVETAEKTSEEKLDIWLKENQDYFNAAQDLANSIQDLANAISESRISAIDEEIQKSDEKWEKELSDFDTYREKDIQWEEDRKRIEETKENARLALERKKSQELRKQAELNKAFAAMQVGLETTIKTIGAYPNPVLMALAIAAGAAQLAIIAATPIPQYAKGTDDHKGGMALVGEERPEVIHEPGKKPYVVSKPTVLDLPRHTKVTPSLEEYEKLMRASMVSSVHISNEKMNDFQAKHIFDSNNKDLINEMRLTRETIKKSKPNLKFISTKAPDLNHEIFKFKNNNWKG